MVQPVAASGLSSAGARRLQATDDVLAQTSDLLYDVRTGIRRNAFQANPDRENERLLRSASETVADLVDNSRVDGRRLFANGTPATGLKKALGVYANSQAEPAAVEAALVKAETALRSIPKALGALALEVRGDPNQTDRSILEIDSQLGDARRGLAAAAQPTNLDLRA
ncbi:MAG: hypothetical protein KIT11_08050 [Fimbriimonadaceae bacterium]|nr:hypothetical protein [Fimbriimonadaceae bacterium]QYK56306.1 MAG: hypothetical protein KF733_02245 [Fimbriimonadaceae bacterium]